MYLLLPFILAFSSHSFAHTADNHNQAVCFNVLVNLNRVTDLDKLSLCSDFFWHNGYYDNGSFNNVIAIEKRIVHLEPQNVSSITNVIWVLWSKWVTWKKDPTNMPDGKNKVDEALQYIQDCEVHNSANPEFYLRVALQMDPLFKYHRNDLIPLSIKFYGRVTALISRSSSQELLSKRLRAELNLGHWYSYKNSDLNKAIYWYSEALITDPSNKVAKRRVDEINRSQTP
jgi:hypothetical protein